MKKSETQINEKMIASLKFAEKGRYVIRDTTLKGFIVIVGKNTKAYFINAEHWKNNKRQFTVKTKIGECGEISARDARNTAKEWLSLVAKGQRPGEDQNTAQKKSFITLRQAWERYRDVHMVRKGRSKTTIQNYRDHIERIFMDWCDKPLAELSDDPSTVAKRHDDLTKSKGPYMANASMRTLRAIYNHALKTNPDLSPKNPVEAIDWNEEKRRNTGMADDQLLNWLREAHKMENPLRKEFHLFTLLSASRPTSLKTAKIEHIDFRNRVLHIPNPKGGAKKAFAIPLSREMIRCLIRTIRLARIVTGDDRPEWLYPADSDSGHIAEHKERRHILSKWGNELRQTYRNLGVVAGIDHLTMHLLMNHSIKDVNAGYITRDQLARTILRRAQQSLSNVIMTEARKGDNENKKGPLTVWLCSKEIKLPKKTQ